MKVIDGFEFNDYCQKCQRVKEQKIAADNSSFVAVCESCQLKRPIIELKQEFYPKTSLWVTRFKVGNQSGIVTGKLADAIKANET